MTMPSDKLSENTSTEERLPVIQILRNGLIHRTNLACEKQGLPFRVGSIFTDSVLISYCDYVRSWLSICFENCESEQTGNNCTCCLCGDVRSVLLTCLGFDGEGKILSVLVSRIDHNIYEVICDSYPGFIFAKNRDGRFIAVNSSLAKEFDKENGSKIKVLGKTDAELHGSSVEAGFFASEDQLVLKGNGPSFIPVERFTSNQNPNNIYTFSVLKTLGMYFHMPIIRGVAADVSYFVSQLEHVGNLYDDILSVRRDALAVVAQRIADQALQTVRITGVSSYAVAVIRWEPQCDVFRILAGSPREAWAGSQLEWSASKESICRYVMQHGEYCCANVVEHKGLVTPVHSFVKAVIAVPVRLAAACDSVEAKKSFWGVISCVSSQPLSDYSVQRALIDLKRYSVHVSNVLRASTFIEAERTQAAAWLSMFLTTHEFRAPIAQSLGDVKGVSCYIKELESILSEKNCSVESLNLIHKIIESTQHATGKLQYLFRWSQVVSCLSRYMTERFTFGASEAIKRARESLGNEYQEIHFLDSLQSAIKDAKDAFKCETIDFYLSSTFSNNDKVFAFVTIFAAMFKNLLRNAIKYSVGFGSEGPIHISIRIRRKIDKDGMLYAVRIKNTIKSEGLERAQMLADFYKGNDQSMISHLGLGSAIISFSAFLHSGAVNLTIQEMEGYAEVCTTLLLKLKGEG